MRATSLIAVLVGSLFVVSGLNAATLIGPSTKTVAGSSVELAAAKSKEKGSAKAKKSSKKGKKGKKGKGKGKSAQTCGKTYMYWDKKAGKCADARDKKTKS
jgi:hypothetical protein